MKESVPSFNPEQGLRYIQNAAKAASEMGDRLWQIDGGDKVLAAASTKETDDAVWVNNLGSIEKGKGKELLKTIAQYAVSVHKQLLVSATSDSQDYYAKIGLTLVPGSNNIWTI